MENGPKVSICVSVYNNALYLAAFLDSALRQSLDDYEIVAADNCSTDDSLRILREYEKAFPDRLFVYRTEENRGAASGRNLAFKKSRGAYIYHCDSDDIIHPRAMEMLYREAVQYDADIVCGYGYEVYMQNDEIVEVREFKKKTSALVENGKIIKHGTHMWLRLFKRTLLEQIGFMPEGYIYEDVRYLTVVHSYAKTIRFLGFPIYYWHRRGTSTTWTVRKELCEDSVEGDRYALSHVNPLHLTDAQVFAAFRNRASLIWYWQYHDIFANYIRKNKDWIYGNETIKRDRYILDGLHQADLWADNSFPNIIYVDGLSEKPVDERLQELRERVFHDKTTVVVLSEDICELQKNRYVKEAWNRGDADLVCGYFALQNIYKTGGVFIHKKIRILNPFGFLKTKNAFFARLDKNTYSDWIYGAPPRHGAIAAILATYSDGWDKRKEYPALAERIAMVLSGKYGISMDGKYTQLDTVGVTVLPPEQTVVDTRYGSLSRRCAFEHDFSVFSWDIGYVTLSRNALKVILDNLGEEQRSTNIEPLKKRIQALEREKAEQQQTNTWKLMMKLRALGDSGAGKILKQPFHRLIRLYKKCRRK